MCVRAVVEECVRVDAQSSTGGAPGLAERPGAWHRPRRLLPNQPAHNHHAGMKHVDAAMYSYNDTFFCYFKHENVSFLFSILAISGMIMFVCLDLSCASVGLWKMLEENVRVALMIRESLRDQTIQMGLYEMENLLNRWAVQNRFFFPNVSKGISPPILLITGFEKLWWNLGRSTAGIPPTTNISSTSTICWPPSATASSSSEICGEWAPTELF